MKLRRLDISLVFPINSGSTVSVVKRSKSNISGLFSGGVFNKMKSSLEKASRSEGIPDIYETPDKTTDMSDYYARRARGRASSKKVRRSFSNGGGRAKVVGSGTAPSLNNISRSWSRRPAASTRNTHSVSDSRGSTWSTGSTNVSGGTSPSSGSSGGGSRASSGSSGGGSRASSASNASSLTKKTSSVKLSSGYYSKEYIRRVLSGSYGTVYGKLKTYKFIKTLKKYRIKVIDHNGKVHGSSSYKYLFKYSRKNHKLYLSGSHKKNRA